jgi:hypothetical protein
VLHGLGRLTLVVAEHHFELAPEDAALGVDLLDGHLHADAIRPGERRAYPAVGVDVADLDGLGRRRGGPRKRQAGRDEDQESS